VEAVAHWEWESAQGKAIQRELSGKTTE